MLSITGNKGSFANFAPVHPKNLEVGKMYTTAELRQNDEGEQFKHFDVAFVFDEAPVGQTKKIKQVRFTRELRTKGLRDIPGVLFYGPIEIDLSGDDLEPMEESNALGNVLERMVRDRTLKS